MQPDTSNRACLALHHMPSHHGIKRRTPSSIRVHITRLWMVYYLSIDPSTFIGVTRRVRTRGEMPRKPKSPSHPRRTLGRGGGSDKTTKWSKLGKHPATGLSGGSCRTVRRLENPARVHRICPAKFPSVARHLPDMSDACPAPLWNYAGLSGNTVRCLEARRTVRWMAPDCPASGTSLSSPAPRI